MSCDIINLQDVAAYLYWAERAGGAKIALLSPAFLLYAWRAMAVKVYYIALHRILVRTVDTCPTDMLLSPAFLLYAWRVLFASLLWAPD